VFAGIAAFISSARRSYDIAELQELGQKLTDEMEVDAEAARLCVSDARDVIRGRLRNEDRLGRDTSEDRGSSPTFNGEGAGSPADALFEKLDEVYNALLTRINEVTQVTHTPELELLEQLVSEFEALAEAASLCLKGAFYAVGSQLRRCTCEKSQNRLAAQ
jgi:hypothetical protein